MRLHTDKITRADILNACARAGVVANSLTQNGSRSRARAFDLYLEGSSNRQSNGRDHKAATWDEWGMVMADLYTLDPEAMWGNKSWGYSDAEDFHLKTQNRFLNGMPYDLHTQHKWTYDYHASMPLSDVAFHYCTGCSARTRRG